MEFVLSCDIVNSSSLSIKEKDELQIRIKEYIGRLLSGNKWQILFYRGDAFQVICEDDYHALSSALGVRTIAKSFDLEKKGLDVRVSMAVGKIDRWPSKEVQAEGSVLVESGQGLDIISKTKRRLRIGGYQQKVETALNHADAKIYGLILDSLVNDWSPRQAECVSYALLGMNQNEIAKAMETKQTAISRFLKISKWEIIATVLERIRGHVVIQKP